MASEKSKYSIPPIMEIQQSFFGIANENQRLKDDIQTLNETILKQRIQLKAANVTIAQQETQLVEAKMIISKWDKLEENSSSSVEKLKQNLEIEQLRRTAAEERVQELGEQVYKLKMLNKMEIRQDSHKEENIVNDFYNDSMETDDLNCNPVSNDKMKESYQLNGTTTNCGEVLNNIVENSELHLNDKDGSFKTELQIIEETLLKSINKLVGKENKPYKRQKCLNKVIHTTKKLVSHLTTMVSEEWVSYTLESPPQSPPLYIPTIYSPIKLWDETSNESTSPPQPSNLPSSSKAIPVKPAETSKVRHEIDMENNNKCLCGHESNNQESLIKHVNRENNGKLFKCENCGDRSRDTSALNLHYKRVHKVKRSYANGCGKCGKTFATKAALKKHVVLFHKSRKVFDVSAIKIRVHQ